MENNVIHVDETNTKQPMPAKFKVAQVFTIILAVVLTIAFILVQTLFFATLTIHDIGAFFTIIYFCIFAIACAVILIPLIPLTSLLIKNKFNKVLNIILLVYCITLLAVCLGEFLFLQFGGLSSN